MCNLITYLKDRVFVVEHRRRMATCMAVVCCVLALSVPLTGCGATGAAAPAGSAADAGSSVAAEKQSTISVTVQLDSSAVDGGSKSEKTYELEEGATALDALKATGADVNVQDSSYGAYVAAVDGIAGGDHGSMSGWMYEVNGEMANESASNLKLADGDTVRWYYTTGE